MLPLYTSPPPSPPPFPIDFPPLQYESTRPSNHHQTAAGTTSDNVGTDTSPASWRSSSKRNRRRRSY